jgi:Flp pilus assembly pilin Flp
MHYRSCHTYLRAALGARAARLRTALSEGDRGASAVELAIITAVILVIAVALLGVIHTFVTNRSQQITQTPTNP